MTPGYGLHIGAAATVKSGLPYTETAGRISSATDGAMRVPWAFRGTASRATGPQ